MITFTTDEKAMERRIKDEFLHILKYLDNVSFEIALRDTISNGELKSLIIVGIISLKQELHNSRKYERDFRKKVANLSHTLKDPYYS